MNKKLIFGLVLVAGAVLAGVLTSGAFFSGRYHTVEMSVSKLTCGSCVENIRAAVSDLDGIGSVETDVAAARSKVLFNPGEIEAERIANIIADAGYPATILSVTDNEGQQIAGIDIDRFVAMIGSRMITREMFVHALQKRMQAAELAGQPVQVKTAYAETWSSMLQQELLYNAASQFGVSIDNDELNQKAAEMGVNNDLERDSLRENLMIQGYLAQQFPKRQPNAIEMNNLINNLYTMTTVDIFDPGLKRSLSSGKSSSGCGGGCCG